MPVINWRRRKVYEEKNFPYHIADIYHYFSLASILTTYVYYEFYVKDAKRAENPVNFTADPMVDNSLPDSSINTILKSIDYSVRFNIIDEDGKVIYDNWKEDIEKPQGQA